MTTNSIRGPSVMNGIDRGIDGQRVGSMDQGSPIAKISHTLEQIVNSAYFVAHTGDFSFMVSRGSLYTSDNIPLAINVMHNVTRRPSYTAAFRERRVGERSRYQNVMFVKSSVYCELPFTASQSYCKVHSYVIKTDNTNICMS